MKAITIHQPYASLIIHGEKWSENREWETVHRGPLAIHAGKASRYLDKDELTTYPTGAMLGIAEMVACVPVEDIRAGLQTQRVREMEDAGIPLAAAQRHEHLEGPFCWILKNIREYREPCPQRGYQKMWIWNEPDLVEFLEP